MTIIATIIAYAFVGSVVFALWGLVELMASRILKILVMVIYAMIFLEPAFMHPQPQV
jgi:hypothetical protein